MNLGIEYSHSSIMTDVLAAVIKFRFQVLKFLYYRLDIQIVDPYPKVVLFMILLKICFISKNKLK